MKYNQIKWLILFLPTITIALWEYVRHEFLLSYISMDMGNFLSPILVFIVTLVFLRHLFSILEKMQEELRAARAKKAALIEREKLARELHDGIAQSLFLLSVKMNKFGRKNDLEQDADFQKIKQTLQHVHEDTRQAITNLKYVPNEDTFSWTETIYQYVTELKQQHFMDVQLEWGIPEDALSSKEKVELFACVKEAVMNVIKHAKTNEVWIVAKEIENGWICQIKDRGIGFTNDTIQDSTGYGLQIIQDRTIDMEWEFSINKIENETILEIKKEGN
ncbi:histidine kinase [Oceanobacillus profundus]|uniref:histidine kinase n=1 Tax=Oceanobacillus profundus TaxID=372463 RepID=A0A417YMM9_9BACI|nr:histidine kinase [Oceanobacillus profundus]MBR3118646.1 two-component sensor histidine kinase [Oceanobacillus sp.]PAE29189.1 two-component sensor histidine kinase [Paenibacillus sp. 7884-2]MCM3398232.1 histidine kinase [Oceanobacillus profundus]MDO6447864.1 histidine kinase [Oceanobacillus profundus]RHW35064.1 two-component sensor histidine kinase [Oceanobacillus profundus]